MLLEALERGLALGELELELELEHPAVPSRPAATTAAPSQVAVRRLTMFIKCVVCHPSDVLCSQAERTGEGPVPRR